VEESLNLVHQEIEAMLGIENDRRERSSGAPVYAAPSSNR
jgi:hypothetical protein